MCRIRLTWVLTLLLIQSGVLPISAQNAHPPLPLGGPPPINDMFMAAPAITLSDLAAVREAIGLASRGRPKDATEAQQRIADPTARKLVEWAILRSGNNGADYARVQAFITANPSWPNVAMFRRRAEAMLWEARPDLAAIRALTGDMPVSAKGRGDPRDPKVDPIDWVERIPFPETRNYVQRIIESVQVSRVQLHSDKRLLIEEDLTRGTLPRFKQTATGRER